MIIHGRRLLASDGDGDYECTRTETVPNCSVGDSGSVRASNRMNDCYCAYSSAVPNSLLVQLSVDFKIFGSHFVSQDTVRTVLDRVVWNIEKVTPSLGMSRPAVVLQSGTFFEYSRISYSYPFVRLQ